LRDLQTRFNCDIVMPGRDTGSTIVTVEGEVRLIQSLQAEIHHLIRQEVPVHFCEASEIAGCPRSHRPVLDLTQSYSEVCFFPDAPNAHTFALDRFLDFLRSATCTLDICVFAISDDRIANVIEDAHNGGVRVRILTDSVTYHNPGSDIERLVHAGMVVKVDAKHGTGRHMHHKFAVLDARVVCSGSFNWTTQAAMDNDENILITTDAALVAQFHSQFERMWAAPSFTILRMP
jgi:phosphatidylserine/phosphatidylglycerophosphate/cardiolipin synthase-like enzyme